VFLAVSVLGGSSWALATNPLFYANVVSQSPDAARVAKAIRSRKVTAVIGDYWVVWPLQLFINIGEGHTPDTIPVTVRTEALPLRVFKLWERSLMARDSIEVACVRHLPHGGDLERGGGSPSGRWAPRSRRSKRYPSCLEDLRSSVSARPGSPSVRTSAESWSTRTRGLSCRTMRPKSLLPGSDQRPLS